MIIQTILITGHMGYIGPVLISELKKSGYYTVGLDTDYFYKDLPVEFLPDKFIHKDIRNINLKDLDNIDHIIHLAGLSNDPLGALNTKLTYSINYDASTQLARLAELRGTKKFIFSSSCSVYGDSGFDDVDEISDCKPLTAYAESKLRVEKELLIMGTRSFVPIILRNATVYGPSPNFRSDLVVNNLLCSGIQNGNLTLLSTGNAWRPIVNILDVARIMVLMLQLPTELVDHQIFNVGSLDANFRILELAKFIYNLTGYPISIREGAESDKRSYKVCFSKLDNLLKSIDYKFVDIGLGIKEMFDQLQLHPELIENSVRLNQLKDLINNRKLDSNLFWMR